MRFAFNDEQQALQDSARRFLRDFSSAEDTRRAMATEPGYDPEVWRRLSEELGWTAVTIPEGYGGFGMTQIELIALMEQAGAWLLCAPFFSSVCLAAPCLLKAGTEAQKRRWLPLIASGTTRATLAWTEGSGAWGPEGIQATFRPAPSGDGFVLEGTKTFVVDGHSAELLLVAARTPGSSGPQGVGLFLVPADSPGLERQKLVTMDQTRPQAQVVLNGVHVPAFGVMKEPGAAWPLLAPALDLARVALAAEQVGGAQRCLDMAVEYARIRVQFGRPIGSFQAIKHKCADMMLQVESARSAAYYAGWVAAHAPPAELAEAAAMAQAYCSEAFFHCAAENIQIHGGIGFTWEHDAHLYFKRARASEELLGSPAFHREQVARHMNL